VHRGFEPPRQFIDELAEGPFRHWVHTHRFIPDGPNASVLEDSIEYGFPLDPLGGLIADPIVRRRLERMFAYRHEITAADLGRHASACGRSLKIAVSGATGLVGSTLCAFLSAGGHEIRRLVRRSGGQAGEIVWDPEVGRIDGLGLEGLDAVVHLAGENIAAGRWSSERKRRILASRVRGTELLARTLSWLDAPPKVLLSASAVGFYGDRGEQPLDESSLAGKGFLAEVCSAWEAAAVTAAASGVRVVNLRFGIVLSPAGGVLARMLPVFRLGAGGRVGSGRQMLSWIGIDDAVGAILHTMCDDGLRGPVNVTAPEPVTNDAFTRTLAGVLRRPAFLPLPAAVVRASLGEMGEALLLSGQNAAPRKLLDAGFRFRHSALEDTLRFELGMRSSASGRAS
jgi:hypothetical protein